MYKIWMSDGLKNYFKVLLILEKFGVQKCYFFVWNVAEQNNKVKNKPSSLERRRVALNYI